MQQTPDSAQEASSSPGMPLISGTNECVVKGASIISVTGKRSSPLPESLCRMRQMYPGLFSGQGPWTSPGRLRCLDVSNERTLWHDEGQLKNGGVWSLAVFRPNKAGGASGWVYVRLVSERAGNGRDVAVGRVDFDFRGAGCDMSASMVQQGVHALGRPVQILKLGSGRYNGQKLKIWRKAYSVLMNR